MPRAAFIACLLLALFSASAGRSETTSASCDQVSAIFEHMRELPDGVLAILGSDMVELGEPFRATAPDITSDLPSNQFSHAKQKGCHLQLDYLSGDSIANQKTAVFDYIDKNWTLRCDIISGGFIDDRIVLPEPSSPNKQQLHQRKACALD